MNAPLRISRAGKTTPPSMLSRLAGIRCPICQTLQPWRPLCGTNPPYRGVKWFDAHACAGCDANLRLTGENRLTQFFLLMVPTFFATSLIGFWLVTQIEPLRYFHETRGHYEPTFLGFILVLALFVFPAQMALLRFEKVAVL